MNHTHPATRHATGLSLVELMVALSLLALLSGLALPVFHDLLARQRVYGVASALLGDLLRARSEAIRSAAPVLLCAGADGRGCEQRPWHQGWLMAADSNGNGVIDDGEPVLGVRGDVEAYAVIGWRRDNLPVSYGADGLTRVGGTFLICVPQEERPRYAVHLHWSGRPRLSGEEENAGRRCPALSPRP